MERIEGRTALVTGGASGIGYGIASALIDAGANVVLTDINTVAIDRAVEALGPAAVGCRLDVCEPDGWQAARAFAEARFGTVSILVNNAGIGPDGAMLADMTEAAFERLVRPKLFGTFHGIATFAAGMRERGEGHIVNTASMAGLVPAARLGAYTASKFAVVGLSEVLRLEMAPSGVGVSVLCPGLVRTRLVETTRAASGRGAGPDGGAAAGAGDDPMAAGMDPLQVGRMVVDGIRTNRPLIVTHRERRPEVARRQAAILSAFD